MSPLASLIIYACYVCMYAAAPPPPCPPSTNIHYILQNLGVKQLILVGCVTDQCVAHAVKDACDLGYLVTLLTGVNPGFHGLTRVCAGKGDGGLSEHRVPGPGTAIHLFVN
jgi:nicotinamidase-related amidase